MDQQQKYVDRWIDGMKRSRQGLKNNITWRMY